MIWGQKFLLSMGLTFFIVGLSSSLSASVYPPRLGNIDLVYLEDPRVDFALRLQSIAEAKVSIKILTYFQAPDAIGKRFITALRAALKRGVKVQFFHEGSLGLLAGDAFSKTTRYLTDADLPQIAEVITGRRLEKMRQGLGLADFEHQKLMLIDEGTPEEKIFIGGRPMTEFALLSLDSAFLLRRIDPSQPSMVDDVRQGFDVTWKELSRRFRIESPVRVSKNDLKKLEADEESPLLDTALRRSQFAFLSKFISISPKVSDALLPIQFRPSSGQWVTNDLFQQLAVNPRVGKSIRDREASLENDILRELSPRIENASTLDFRSYALALPPALRTSVGHFLERGGRGTFYTNGLYAHSLLFPKGLPVFYTLEAGASIFASPNAQVQFYEPPKNPLFFRYLHERMMILDGRTVVTGSDPFTSSSAWKNSESILILEDPRLADFLVARQSQRSAHFRHMTPDRVSTLLKQKPWWSGCAAALIRAVY